VEGDGGRRCAARERTLDARGFEKVKLHVWFMRLACFLTRFLSLHWGSIPYLAYFRWRFHFGMLGCIYKKLYSPLISTYFMELRQLCFSSCAVRNVCFFFFFF